MTATFVYGDSPACDAAAADVDSSGDRRGHMTTVEMICTLQAAAPVYKIIVVGGVSVSS